MRSHTHGPNSPQHAAYLQHPLPLTPTRARAPTCVGLPAATLMEKPAGGRHSDTSARLLLSTSRTEELVTCRWDNGRREAGPR